MRGIKKIGRWIFIVLTAKPQAIAWIVRIVRRLVSIIAMETIREGTGSPADPYPRQQPPAGEKEPALHELARKNEKLTDALRRLHRRQLWLIVFTMLALLTALIGLYQQYDHRRSHRVTAAEEIRPADSRYER